MNVIRTLDDLKIVKEELIEKEEIAERLSKDLREIKERLDND